VPVLTKEFHPMSKNAYALENGYASNFGRSGETFLIFGVFRAPSLRLVGHVQVCPLPTVTVPITCVMLIL
jgi:hypothetical protein